MHTPPTSPPTLPDAPPPRVARPFLLRLFGVLNIIVGIAGLLLPMLVNARPQAMWPQPLVEAERAAVLYRQFSWFPLAAGIVLAIVLCVAGIGLLDARGWGRTLSQRWSGYTIPIQLASAVVWFVDVFPRLSAGLGWLPIESQRRPLVALSLVGLAAPLASVLYALLLLAVMRRRSVRDCLAAAAAATAIARASPPPLPAPLPPPLPGSPEHADRIMAVVRAFGFSTLLFGISGLLGAVMNAVMLALRNDAWPGYELDGSRFGRLSPSPQCVAANYGSFLVAGLLAIAGIVIGIGLQRGRPWSRTAATRWSCYTICLAIVCLFIWISFPLANMLAATTDPASRQKLVGGFLRPFATAFFPTLLLLVMKHPAVRAVFTVPARGSGAAPGRLGDYADFPARVGAFLVDLLIFFLLARIAAQIIDFCVHLRTFQSGWVERQMPAAGICLLVVNAVMALIYPVALEMSARQGTPGKQVLGLVVTDLHGRRISFARALARSCARFLSLMCCGIGYLLPLFTARKQTLHDVIAGCVVVRK